MLLNSSDEVVFVEMGVDGIAYFFSRHVPSEEGGRMQSESWKWSLHMRQELAAFHGSGSSWVCSTNLSQLSHIALFFIGNL